MKIDEYVPLTTPSSSASVKVRIVGGPSRSSAPSVTTTVSDVMIERADGLQDRVVHDRAERLAGMPDAVLADAVEHHDRVVHAEADDRQQRGHEQRVELEVEEVAEDRERPDDEDHVVEQGDDRRGTESEAESHPQVGEDEQLADDDQDGRACG